MNNLQHAFSWNWKWFYFIRAFRHRGAAREGLQIPSCPANNGGNSWFHSPFFHPLSEPGAGALPNEGGRDGSDGVSLPWPGSEVLPPHPPPCSQSRPAIVASQGRCSTPDWGVPSSSHRCGPWPWIICLQGCSSLSLFIPSACTHLLRICEALWDASVIFPFYGASNKTKGRRRAWLIFMATDPLFGGRRKTGPTRQSSQESPTLKTPGSTCSYTHHTLQKFGIATAALRQVKSRGGLCRAFGGGNLLPQPPASPLLIQEGGQH